MVILIDIRDGLLTQDADIADTNVQAASALIENYISIKTSDVEIYELVLSKKLLMERLQFHIKQNLLNRWEQKIQSSLLTLLLVGERNGEFIIGNSEVVQYKEKSLNQFIECTRSVNGIVEDWDSATRSCFFKFPSISQ